MADTFELISRVTVGSGGSTTISFSSIPSTFTDLVLKVSARTANATTGEVANISLNGSSSSISVRSVYGDGASVASTTSTSYGFWVPGTGAATADVFGNAEMYFPNYAGSTYKSWSSDSITEANATGAYNNLFSGLWSNTAAINQITITAGASSTFVQNSTAYLYGIKKS